MQEDCITGGMRPKSEEEKPICMVCRDNFHAWKIREAQTKHNVPYHWIEFALASRGKEQNEAGIFPCAIDDFRLASRDVPLIVWYVYQQLSLESKKPTGEFRGPQLPDRRCQPVQGNYEVCESCKYIIERHPNLQDGYHLDGNVLLLNKCIARDEGYRGQLWYNLLFTITDKYSAGGNPRQTACYEWTFHPHSLCKRCAHALWVELPATRPNLESEFDKFNANYQLKSALAEASRS